MKMRGTGCCLGDILESMSVVTSPESYDETLQDKEKREDVPVRPSAVV